MFRDTTVLLLLDLDLIDLYWVPSPEYPRCSRRSHCHSLDAEAGAPGNDLLRVTQHVWGKQVISAWIFISDIASVILQDLSQYLESWVQSNLIHFKTVVLKYI